MYKAFTLAAVIAILPVSQEIIQVVKTPQKQTGVPPLGYALKTNPAFKPFGPLTTTTNQTPGQLKQSNWYANAMQNIEQSEYHFNWEEKQNAYCTPNRKQNLRFFYSQDGFSVEPRQTKIPVDKVDKLTRQEDIKYHYLPNWKIKFNLDKKQTPNGKWQIENNKAEYITDKITVQYINNDEGMRQNFIVHAPLTNDEELKINFSINTTLKTSVSQNQLQFFHKKTNVLNYEDLKVWDANGKTLTASFQKGEKGKYYIQVGAKDAVYPITIDPISTTPAATVQSNQVHAQMGISVASAGDVNGDGYSDVIVGAYQYDNGQINEGRAFVYHGSATGISTTASAVVERSQVGAQLGISVASAGDVNGDGYSDVIVGANLSTNWQGDDDAGAAFVYHGSATGISTTEAAHVQNIQAGAEMGYSVASAGDVNGDGYSDVIVGAYLYGQFNDGRVYVYHGSATGISTTEARIIEGRWDYAHLGVSVASAGDVNGDGYSDVIVGADQYSTSEQINEGAALVYHGSATGISSTFQAAGVQGSQGGARMGVSVASAGDVNGDGYSDVIVGAYRYDNGQTDEGAAFVYHGSASGISTTAAATVESNQNGAEMGYSVASAGDVNGDGYSDVIVGANFYDNGHTDEGAAFLYHGSASGISTTAAATVESNQVNAQMGVSVASAGDVNGDGYSDVIAGAHQYDNGQTGEGAAFVYHGAAAGISITAAAIAERNQADAQMGVSVASAGDVNGDGYSDVIVGAPAYDNGSLDEGAAFVYHGAAAGISTTPAATVESNQASAFMGRSVASAGDVNGDGYGDVIVGAPLYDNGQTNEGRAFVYHGSATGISTTTAANVESNQAAAEMGYSVASAGDVNGDGYSDVIVGAYQYDNGQTGEGAAFVYHGSTTGITTTAAATVQSNQVGAQMGLSVASAGDVNGDGYSDVIVGAWQYDNGQTDEGAAFVYRGSATGISTTAAAIREGNQADARMGFSVASAGDVNGDGYSDVIMGAYLIDNGQTDEGAAFVYHGSATGISTTVAAFVQSNQASARMGVSVASAGDVNGDGYSDVIVGADFYDNGQTDEGAAFVYHGSATGISTTAADTVESNQANARMGVSAASAGDVNGDGYSDVIVGADQYDNGQTNEGAAFVYHGNSPGTNKRNNLRLYNTNLTTPINSSNFIPGNFGAGLFAKSFLGRAEGKLVWETRLNYNPYSGMPITNSTFFTAQQVTYTNLGLAGVELKNLIPKMPGGRYTRIRARIKYYPVTAITGQVYGPWRNVSSIINGSNLGVLPLDLISFNAAWLQKGKTARLDFTTDNESGICCFEIEKSNDGFNYSTIATLPAKNTNRRESYTFIDDRATAKSQYYRLKIKSTAGQPEYSNIQHLKNGAGTEILAFPNPAGSVLQLQLNGRYDKLHVRIVNSAGQTVKRLTAPAANQTITIPVHDLPAGNYWLHLQGGEEKQVLQFVKQ